MANYSEDCCWNTYQDVCKGRGCICDCHAKPAERMLVEKAELRRLLAAAEARAVQAEQERDTAVEARLQWQRDYDREKRVTWSRIQHLTATLAARDAALAEMREALENAKDDYERMLAGTPSRGGITYAPEDAAIRLLCEHWGYGAVISRAAYLWQVKDPVGAFLSGPCVGTAESGLAKIRKVLKQSSAVLSRQQPATAAVEVATDG